MGTDKAADAAVVVAILKDQLFTLMFFVYVRSISGHFVKGEAINIELCVFSFGPQEEFSLKDEWKFKEDTDYRLATAIGAGAFGKCYVGAVQRVNTEEERVFCVKKVRPMSIATSFP